MNIETESKYTISEFYYLKLLEISEEPVTTMEFTNIYYDYGDTLFSLGNTFRIRKNDTGSISTLKILENNNGVRISKEINMTGLDGTADLIYLDNLSDANNLDSCYDVSNIQSYLKEQNIEYLEKVGEIQIKRHKIKINDKIIDLDCFSHEHFVFYEIEYESENIKDHVELELFLESKIKNLKKSKLNKYQQFVVNKNNVQLIKIKDKIVSTLLDNNVLISTPMLNDNGDITFMFYKYNWILSYSDKTLKCKISDITLIDINNELVDILYIFLLNKINKKRIFDCSLILESLEKETK